MNLKVRIRRAEDILVRGNVAAEDQLSSLKELNDLLDYECHCAEPAVTTLYKASSTDEEKEKKL